MRRPQKSPGAKPTDATYRNVRRFVHLKRQVSHAYICGLVKGGLPYATMDEPAIKRQKVSGKYFPGTSLPIMGWIQPCRKCNVCTGRTIIISNREIPLCARCQQTVKASVSRDQNTEESKRLIDAIVERNEEWRSVFRNVTKG